MATYNQVGYGSKGSDVQKLQELLNQNGYNLDTDGIFGSNTQNAVKEYQQKNGFTVDGIVGKNTWGALTSASTATPSTPTTTPTQTETKAPTFEYGAYKPSDTVSQAEALLQQQMAQKPGAYQSTWTEQLNDTIQKILNREKFSYDLNGDAMYQQYADQYVTKGKMASMDTMGQAAALTGGYGNSYAQNVGQQAYQAYLQQLNEVVPELYGMALDQYNQEGQNLYNQAALMAQQEDQDYGRYMDGLNAWLTERDYLAGRYDTERDYDYGKWADGRDFGYGQYIDDRNMAYQQDRDKVADQQWQAQFDEAKRQYDQQYALSTSKGSGSSGSGGNTGGNGNTGGGYDNAGYDTDIVKRAQDFVGASADGKWGDQSSAAAKAKGYNSLAQVVAAMDKGGDTVPVDTENTKLFRSSIMTVTEFNRHGNRATVKGKTYTDYKNYIEACLADWTDNDVPYLGKNLTDDEVNFLMDYYGL